MTHPGDFIAQFLSLPKLKVEAVYRNSKSRHFEIVARSESVDAVHTRCGTLCTRVYDTRRCRVRDVPIRDHKTTLVIWKFRYYCKTCRKPFTEPIAGVFSRSRITDRLRRHILWDGKRVRALKDVACAVGLSLTTVQRHFYPALRIEEGRHLNYPWPEKISFDEKRFGKNKNGYGTRYHTLVTDLTHDRIYDVLFTKNSKTLFAQLKDRPGAENVKHVGIDMCEAYRSLSRALFPNALITVDKFHVVKLLTPAINRRRKQIVGDRRNNPIGNLLLRSGFKLDFFKRSLIARFLSPHEELKAIYEFKERLHSFYRIKGYRRAASALEHMIEDLKYFEQVKELKTLRWTLLRWKNEILNYFISGVTNAMAEGFNNKISVLKNNAYGYNNEENYRLRILSACF
jgi:transposase